MGWADGVVVTMQPAISLSDKANIMKTSLLGALHLHPLSCRDSPPGAPQSPQNTGPLVGEESLCGG